MIVMHTSISISFDDTSLADRQDCEHSTTGDHCEQCIAGYHGDATGGSPYDCLICACPLPIDSNK